VSARVLHVTPCLARGGAGRALLDVAAAADGYEHRVLSLAPAMTSPEGLDLVDVPAAGELRRELAGADLVQLHFWNMPELYELLETELPPLRLLVWSHVAGRYPPQVLLPELVEYADGVVSTTALQVGADELEVIPPALSGARARDAGPVAHTGFNVGYIGTVDHVKLHPDYVAMSASVDIPDVRFIVYGKGAGFGRLAAQAAELGVGERFDLRGWSADVPSVLAEFDVFGYPLCEDNYSTCELVLQETMAAGIPPVVLPHGGAARTVTHGETGVVARDPDGYARAIEHLYAHPAARRRLGEAARDHARRAWAPAAIGERWATAYEKLLARPKRARRWPLAAEPSRFPGAARFVRSLGATAPQFAASLTSTDTDHVLAADAEIAASSPVLRSADAGGVLHYRRRYPDDAFLRLWAGLVLARQGRHALAAGEFVGARRLGLEEARVARYLDREGRALGRPGLERRAFAAVPGEA
jgi:glycosyltransferase involved in cell wall biosynthesis